MAFVKERSNAESHACVFLFGFLASGSAVAQGEDFSKVEMKVQKVAGTVYMLEGAGGNIGASVGDDGIVMVDDEFLPWQTRLRPR
jgi:nitrate/nitrite transporter NarK